MQWIKRSAWTKRTVHLKKVLLASLLLGLLLLAVGLSGKPVLDAPEGVGRIVTDRHGDLMRLTTNQDEHYRIFAPLDAISKHVVEATLLYEDRYFYYHFGVNPVALVKAALDSYLLGGRRRGASTITMQLARMRFGLETTTPWGKLVQIFYALKLETHYTKQEILEAYLNLAPYGGNVVGIRAASLIYFGKEPADLGLPEAMTLSVFPQSPEQRKPTKAGREPEVLQAARNRLATAWKETHPDQRAVEMVPGHALAMKTPDKLPFIAPHLTTDLLLEDRETREIPTTIDSRLQRMVQGRIRDYVRRNAHLGITNAAVMLVEADTMAVRAAVGSADFTNDAIEGQVNGMTARRSPGSTLKPFVYALAMDQGLIHPGSLLKDAPAHFAEYTPDNFDGAFTGPLTATEALVRSRNIPAIALAAQLEGEGFYGFLKKAGISGLRPKASYGLAPVLGGIELTMEELVTLYAMLKNGGVLRPLVKRTDRKTSPPASPPLLSREGSFLTLEMLEQNPRPGQRFQETWIRDRVYAAWKTGTSPGARDAWSVGVTGPYVLAVWVGQFSGGKPIYVGRKAAAPLFFDIIDSLRAVTWLGPLEPDDDLNVRKVSVCALTGSLPNPHCPHQKESWYIPGVSPIAQCTIHRPVEIDSRTGLRSCRPNAKHNRTEVFAFWPSDLRVLFAEAGLKLKVPPPYNKGCVVPLDPEPSTVLKITSPRNNVTYAARADRMAEEKVALKAVSDADAAQLFWFIDKAHVGTVPPMETLFWTPRPGTFTVRVVDDKGRTDSRLLNVTVVE
jgi:penicillin-binding protein 1C